MKQGMTKKMKPKHKHETKSWQRRNELRKPKQEAHLIPATVVEAFVTDDPNAQ